MKVASQGNVSVGMGIPGRVPVRRSIRTKLVIYFSLLFAVVLGFIQVVGIVGTPFGSWTGRKGAETTEVFRGLNLVADLKKDRLLRWLEKLRNEVQVTAKNKMVETNIALLRATIRRLTAAGRKGAELWAPVRGEKSYEDLTNFIRLLLSTYGIFYEIHIAEAKTGTIIVSTDDMFLGMDISKEPSFTGPLFTPAPHITDVSFDPRHDILKLSVSHTIADRGGKVAAVLVMEAPIESIIKPIFLAGEGLGKTGEALLVNGDVKIITRLKHPLPDGTEAKPLAYQIKARPAILAAGGEEGIIESDDYRKEPVLAAYRHIRVTSEWGWGMVVKRDVAELFAPLRKDMALSSIIGLVGILLVIALTFFIAKGLTRPIWSLSQAAGRVAEGALDARVPVTSSDEVGYLARTFNIMVGRIQERTSELAKANEQLEGEIAERKKTEEDLLDRKKELQEAQEELIRKERLAVLGELAGAVNHELRNPLGVINNSVYYLKMVLPEDENLKKHLGILEREVGTASRIVSGLLDLARPQLSTQAQTDLSGLVRESLEQTPLEENIRVVTNLSGDLPPVFVDQEQIKRVVCNLIVNAAQAMPDGGTLTIETAWADGGAQVAVSDTGVGIARENLEKIFEPLFTTKAKGIGLGLYLARRLTESCGGTIAVESTAGSGSRFVVRFAAQEKEEG